ncbi:MerR family transcriptional regulator [Streptomyces sp. NPDC060198]|uniref:MerR family transcriptional regulator n=1 Tax=Streptomyces sp. NPDC060198 TaxID=3347070 RepID=UPI0036669AF6
MRIGDLAEATGVNRRLLRYYEEQGLLRPRRLANGYRDYDDGDVVAVRSIRYLLAGGLPTSMIAGLMHCVHAEDDRLVPSGCRGMVSALQRETARVAEAIAGLRASQEALDTMLAAAVRKLGE